jgi:L-lactate dehydrogenase complex protein LldF
MLANSQMRRNVRNATDIIQNKREKVVRELPDWEQLREAGAALRAHALEHLDHYLTEFEAACIRSGGKVHWAVDSADAQRIVLRLLEETGVREVIKIKSMTTEEIRLNSTLDAAGIRPIETDLAELINQLGGDRPSHIVVPALHKNRQQIRDIFSSKMNLPDLSDEPEKLTAAARKHLRKKFLAASIAICGANFLIAENGAVCIVESEGNGRMCLTLPRKLIAIAGIDKIIPRFQDLEVMLQTLPRSATGERMNPYNSLWTGVHCGDGPEEFHVVLLDNGRSRILADSEARQTLQCIRCAACVNACPVYHHTGGHAYDSVYSGPIGAILTPQLAEMEAGRSLPFASTLCGACYQVCPVKINIPEVLIHLRSKIVQRDGQSLGGALGIWNLGMQAARIAFEYTALFTTGQKLARMGQKVLVSKDGFIEWLPSIGGGWTKTRDLPEIPAQTFREWWSERRRARAKHE